MTTDKRTHLPAQTPDSGALSRSGRDPLLDVMVATRLSLQRVRSLNLRDTVRDVHSVIIEEIASYSRLSAPLGHRRIADLTGLSRGTVWRALTKLHECGVIVHNSGKGGDRSVISLPSPTDSAASGLYLCAREQAVARARNKRSVRAPIRRADGAREATPENERGAREPTAGNGTRREVLREVLTSGGSSKDEHASDPLFDALLLALGIKIEDLTSSARGAINKALKDLREVGATPTEVRARAQRYKQLYPTWGALTASALAKHWPSLAVAVAVSSPAPEHLDPLQRPCEHGVPGFCDSCLEESQRAVAAFSEQRKRILEQVTPV